MLTFKNIIKVNHAEILDSKFDESLMIIPEQKSKIDIEYKNICFQIKRIRPEWLYPTKTDNELISKIEKTNNYAELLKVLEKPARDFPIAITQNDTLNILQKQIEDTSNKTSNKTGALIYLPEIKCKLDLHFYFLNDGSDGYPPVSKSQIKTFNFNSFGWRTVSYQLNNQFRVLSLSKNSSSLIKKYEM